VHVVGIDRIIERAGVAKASLYNVFGSKDELVRAYLEARHVDRERRIAARLATCATARDGIVAVFDVVGEIMAEPGFRGCAFANAGAESRPGEAVEGVTDEAGAWTSALFVDLAARAGAADPALLGRHLQRLYDGALASARLDRDPAAATAARSVAVQLVDSATSTD
jgi:AcrR family transcriptional regulator